MASACLASRRVTASSVASTAIRRPAPRVPQGLEERPMSGSALADVHHELERVVRRCLSEYAARRGARSNPSIPRAGGGDDAHGARGDIASNAVKLTAPQLPSVRRGSQDLVPVGYEGRLAGFAWHG
jgi:hypothetical protein